MSYYLPEAGMLVELLEEPSEAFATFANRGGFGIMSQVAKVRLTWWNLALIALIVWFFSLARSGESVSRIEAVQQSVDQLQHKIGYLEHKIDELKTTAKDKPKASPTVNTPAGN